ncbi:MAG: site-specific DNA-methyltransferase [Anaerolineae bacterium]|nr:site-specific DNA-methyltransferase [Anaerolineae bacterium]
MLGQLALENAGTTRPALAKRFSADADVTLHYGDCLDLLRDIADRDCKAELIVTSPPYNTGKEYEQQVSLPEYIAAQRRTIEACLSVLSRTGSICWQVGHYIEGSGREKEAFPLDLVLYPVFKELGLKLRNRIVWHFGHGLHERFRFSGRHETILWFTRDVNDYTFNLDAVRIPQKYPGKRAFRGPNRGRPSGNPLGKNPCDVWDMPNVKANHVEKTEHPCQFPVALVERLILALSNKGDLVVDPYIGVGTTAVAAVRQGRRAAGADIEARYIKIAKERLEAAWSGSLRVRPLNKPVYEPHTNTTLTQVPDEWQNETEERLL